MPSQETSTTEGTLQRYLTRFDETMEPGSLEKAVNILKEIPDRDGQGNILPEVRAFKLKSLFRIFRLASEAIDVNYIPWYVRTVGKSAVQPVGEPAPIPAKVGSAYLHDYIQSGLRVFRFQLRVEILDYIRSAYQGVPSQEERMELLSQANAVEPEFREFLSDLMKSEVSWKLDQNNRLPHEAGKKGREAELADLMCCMQQMHILESLKEPLYLPDDVCFMNIAPPAPVYPDSMCISGQAADSIKNPESRRQYLIALNENARKNEGYSLRRKLEDDMSNLQRVFFRSFESSKLLDSRGMQELSETAEKSGMSGRFMDNLHEAIAIREIDAEIKLFEKTKDAGTLEKASSMLEAFPICKNRMRGREFLDTYQLERWLMLFHAMSSDETFKDKEKFEAELEEKIMNHIFKSCGKSCYRLRDARWWLRAYGMRKPLVERIDLSIQGIVQEEKQKIESRLAAIEQTFSSDSFTQTTRLVCNLTHKDYKRDKSISDILDFKVRCMFRLLAVLESRIDPAYGTNPPRGIPATAFAERLVLKVKPASPKGGYGADLQPKLHELHRDCRYRLVEMLKYEYGSGLSSQERALQLMTEIGVTPEFRQEVKSDFDRKNLNKSLSNLGYNKKGEPSAIAVEIDRFHDERNGDSSNEFRPLTDRLSDQFRLLAAMEKSGIHGAGDFERKLIDRMKKTIHEDLPDTWAGYLALMEVASMAKGSPLEAEAAALREKRMKSNKAVFHEKLAAFEKSGDLMDLYEAMEKLNYIIRSRGWSCFPKDRADRREYVEVCLRLIRSVSPARAKELVNRQSTPPDVWGKGWNTELPPQKLMGLLLDKQSNYFHSILFSHIRQLVRDEPDALEEIRKIIGNSTGNETFRKTMEERLAEVVL